MDTKEEKSYYEMGREDGYREGVAWANMHQAQTFKEELDILTDEQLAKKYRLARIPVDSETGKPFLIGDEVIVYNPGNTAHGKVFGYEILGRLQPADWTIVIDTNAGEIRGYICNTKHQERFSDRIYNWIERASCDMGADMNELKEIADDLRIKQNAKDNSDM